jgi:predicted dehydrogenase
MTLRVAVAGLGFMGATHARAWLEIPEATLAAVISNDERKLAGDLSSVGGNLGLAFEPLDFSRARKYHTLDEALKDPEIDVLDICLPTDRHASAAMAALAWGKHVLVEKPLALSVENCSKLLEEAKRCGKLLMAAQVLRFLPAWMVLADLVRRNGPVRSALFRRRCAAPDWSPWLNDPARSGGGVFDLLIHDVDFCISLWGTPETVRATGYEDLPRGIDLIHAELGYAGLGPVIVTGGWHHPKRYPFSMQFTVVTDGATVEWQSGDEQLRVYRNTGEMEARELDAGDPFARELSYFARCALTGERPELCPPEQSAAAVEVMLKMLESRRRGGETIECRQVQAR